MSDKNKKPINSGKKQRTYTNDGGRSSFEPEVRPTTSPPQVNPKTIPKKK